MDRTKQNQSWISLAFVWAGALVSIPSLLLGGTLAAGMSLTKTLVTAFIGYALVVVIMIFQGMQSADLGKPTVKVAEQVFGEKGSQRVISILIAIGCLGWFGIQANVCGAAFVGFLKSFGITMPISVASLIWGLIMVITAIYGIKVIRLLTYVAVPYLILVCLYGLYQALTSSHVALLSTYRPAAALPISTGLTITLGSFAIGAVIAGDYSQYSPKRRDVIKAAIFGVIPAGVLMIGVGAVLSIVYQSADINSAFLKIGTPAISSLALVLGTWKVNVINAFSGGIAVNNALGIPEKFQKLTVFLVGIAGTILAILGIMNYFTPVMNILGAMIPPVAGVMSAAYWITHKGDSDKWQSIPGFKWSGIIAWLLGGLVASVPVIMGLIPHIAHPQINPLTGIILSFVAYLVLQKIEARQAVKNRLSEE
jgi:cytosine permease